MKEKLLKELEEIFPDKILKNYSKNIPYNLKKELTKELGLSKGISLKQYLIKNLNFKEYNKNVFDYETIKLLQDKYLHKGNYERKIFQNIQKISKQRIEQKIKKTLKSKTSLNWETEELNPYERKIFQNLIENKKFKEENKTTIMFIFQNSKNCLILIYDKENEKFKTISNENNKYIKKLLQHNFHKYNEKDFSNISYLEKIDKNNKVQVTAQELYASKNKKKMIFEKYINFLGYQYVHPNKYTDNDIIKILKRNIYPETKKDIYIPTDSKDAQQLRTLAARNNKRIKDLVEDLGFNYHIRDGYLRIKKTLNFIKNENNEIWLPAKGDFYSMLCSNANKKNMKLNNYINEFNLTRIEKNIDIDKEKEYVNKIDVYYNSLKSERKNNYYELNEDYQINEKEMNFIKNIEMNLKNIESPNEKEVIIKQRLTQGLFRKKLIKRECKCKICNIKDENFLVASHIKPWVEANNYEKVDENNGFLFCPNHDKLFDKGYISFQDNGKLIISDKLNKENIELLGLNTEIKVKIDEDVKKYLEFHREVCLKK